MSFDDILDAKDKKIDKKHSLIGYSEIMFPVGDKDINPIASKRPRTTVKRGLRFKSGELMITKDGVLEAKLSTHKHYKIVKTEF